MPILFILIEMNQQTIIAVLSYIYGSYLLDQYKAIIVINVTSISEFQNKEGNCS
jgi:hypothetical protein